MRFNNKILATALVLLSVKANAGLYATTIHSRANCVNNESITWYAGHYYNWRVYSFHWYDMNHTSKGYHVIDTGMSLTWRQAAVHWGESGIGGKYMVHGAHYYMWNGHVLLDNVTDVTDCSIYNGWWD